MAGFIAVAAVLTDNFSQWGMPRLRLPRHRRTRRCPPKAVNGNARQELRIGTRRQAQLVLRGPFDGVSI